MQPSTAETPQQTELARPPLPRRCWQAAMGRLIQFIPCVCSTTNFLCQHALPVHQGSPTVTYLFTRNRSQRGALCHSDCRSDCHSLRCRAARWGGVHGITVATPELTGGCPSSGSGNCTSLHYGGYTTDQNVAQVCGRMHSLKACWHLTDATGCLAHLRLATKK